MGKGYRAGSPLSGSILVSHAYEAFTSRVDTSNTIDSLTFLA